MEIVLEVLPAYEPSSEFCLEKEVWPICLGPFLHCSAPACAE